MKYYIEQLDSNDCGAACLAMICKYYKKDFTITKLRDLLGTDIKGTPLNGLHHGAEQIGFDARKVRITKDVIHEKFTLPAICHIRTSEGAGHFVVLMKVLKSKVILLDPACGVRKISIDAFFNMFDGIVVFLYPKQKFYDENISNTKGVFKIFSSLLMAQKKPFIYSIVASIVLTILGILYSLFNKVLMDEILPNGLKRLLVAYTIGFGLVLIARIVLNFVREHIVLYISQKIDLPLMLGYFNHIFKLPMNFFANRKIGDITTRFQDAFVVKNVLTETILTIVVDIILAIATCIILLNMNIKLFLVLIVVTVFSILLVYTYKGVYKKLNKKQMEQSAILNSTIIDGLRGIETLKANAYENNIVDKIEENYVASIKTSFNQRFHNNTQNSLSALISGLGNLILMSLGVYLVIQGDITIGTVLAFFTISGYFLDPIGRLINCQLSIQEAEVSLRRLSEIYDIAQEEEFENKSQFFDSDISDIEINNVSFRYGKRQLALKDISISIKKGKKIAIVGESGSGKTTLSKLLLKFYKVENGTILYDGIDINNLNAFEIRKKIGYVPQNVEMFSGTVIDNLRIAKENASEEEIRYACELTGCNKFISKMNFGYYTFLDETGGGLSGGEKQRLALARAFLKKPQFIILDEATSNLDFQTENDILNLLFSKKRSTTMLIIAHRLSTIKNCDEIIVFDQGEIIEKGKHDDLLLLNGKYKKLWDFQQGNTVVEKNTIEEIRIDDTNNDIIEYK